jgi:hypothetical protein
VEIWWWAVMDKSVSIIYRRYFRNRLTARPIVTLTFDGQELLRQVGPRAGPEGDSAF